MLGLLALCDSSGFYDELLTLLRRHIRKGFVVMKAKGREAFLGDMRKKVPTPQPRKAMALGCEIAHFSFLEMLRDLLRSSKFSDAGNLRASQEASSRFARLIPTSLEDYSETMSKQLGRKRGFTHTSWLPWATRSHRAICVEGSPLTQETRAGPRSNTDNHSGCRLVDHDAIRQLSNLALVGLDESTKGPAKAISDAASRGAAAEKCKHKSALRHLR